jgi:RNA polymerase sigma-70 factor (ECF subfamily)
MAPEFSDDGALVVALRAGDEAAFTWLLARYHGPLHRTARMYVATDAQADEVVQETWLAVLRGIDRFEQRSSLKTWLYRILMNIARTRGVKESRSIPFSSASGALAEGAEPTFDADRFRPADDPDWPGHWAAFPLDWEHQPESRLLARETLSLVAIAIEQLPPSQREVLTLRDVEGWSSTEVCNALGLTETNQRVLLHRGRAKVRRALESYFEGSVAS